MGRRWTKEKGSFTKHLHRSHTCQCGKVIKGNAFYNHIKTCEKYKVWRAKKGEEFREYMRAKGFKGY